jgi:aspartate/glutamate racemase
VIHASQAALASPALHAPVRSFQHYEAALGAMADYEAALRENAWWRRSNGFAVTDQDQPEEVFCLFPARAVLPPLALIGGLGPLAGAAAFRQACARFRDSRAVTLYQACSLPDRSTVILEKGEPDTPAFSGMASRLAGAVRQAAGLASPDGRTVRCIIVCNSAHYFWRRLEEHLQTLPGQSCEVQMISLVEASRAALQLQSRKVLLLTTEGARAGQVFSAPFRQAGICFEEPSHALNRLLMRVIFEGMKSLDDRRAAELGNQFFEAILGTGRDYDCVLAGCTELPLTIDLLRRCGSPEVAAFLSRVKIVDPVEEALGWA